MPPWLDPVLSKLLVAIGSVGVFYLKSIAEKLAELSTSMAVAISRLDDHGVRIEKLEDRVFLPESGRH